MAKFLLACYPIPGHLHPNIALAQALASRGHLVAFYTGQNARKTVIAQGFDFFPFSPEFDNALTEILMPQNANEFVASDISTMKFSFRESQRTDAILRKWFLESIPSQLDDLRRIQQQWAPAVIVSDVGLLGPPLFLADLTPTPVAIFCVVSACPIPGPQAPTWGRGLPPPRTFFAKVRSSIERLIQNVVLRNFRSYINVLRESYGLPRIAVPAMEFIQRAPLFLVVGTTEFDYARTDLPATVQYVGACLWHGTESSATATDEWKKFLSSGRPNVYVTQGTVNMRPRFLLDAAAEGLRNENVQLLMTTGGARATDDLPNIFTGDNIRIEPYIPHGEVFPHVDAVVTTGGAGTILAALINGVPLVVVPTGWDLPENAQRVVEAGVGLRVDPRRCTGATLRAAVLRVLSDPRFKQRAVKMGRLIRERGGPDRAAEMLERLL